MQRVSKVADLARVMAALADPTRLRLLNLMRGREVCVCYFVEILQQSQPKVSRHLATLRRAGLVSARRDGKWMHYRIEPKLEPAAEDVLSAVMAALEADDAMQRDLERMGKACCSPGSFVTLEGVPTPQMVDTA
jgi:ArsR family transcriptional regulator